MYSAPNRTASRPGENDVKIVIRALSVHYGRHQALREVTLAARENEITALIGPSGCGKTTVLRSLNRMIETVPNSRLHGQVMLDGENLYQALTDPVAVRRRFGWVTQSPNPLPCSIYDNVSYGLRVRNAALRADFRDAAVTRALKDVGLWQTVRHNLSAPARSLSLGEQQRLCVARAIANDPEVLLLDEPCASLDPPSAARIEDLIDRLRARHTILMATHNLQQAGRLADRVVYLYQGRLVEAGPAAQIFTAPGEALTRDYLNGRIG